MHETIPKNPERNQPWNFFIEVFGVVNKTSYNLHHDIVLVSVFTSFYSEIPTLDRTLELITHPSAFDIVLPIKVAGVDSPSTNRKCPSPPLY